MGYSAAAARFCALPVVDHRKGDQPWQPRHWWCGSRPSPAKKTQLRNFSFSALPLVEQEPGTKPWFAVQFGPSTFGIIDEFPDEAARETHLGGPVGKALAEKTDELFDAAPTSAISTLSPTSSDVSTAASGCEGSHVPAKCWAI